MNGIEAKFDEGLFIEKVFSLFPEAVRASACLDVESQEFDQGWPNSAGGLCRPGDAVCDVLIHEPTVIAKASGFDGRSSARPLPKLEIYGVYFGGRFAYAVLNPEEGAFLDDLRNRCPASVGEAKERYGNECEEIWILPPLPRRRIRIRGNSARE